MDFTLTPSSSAKSKIDLKRLQTLIFDEGKSQKECAEIFQVNEATVSRALKRIRSNMPIVLMTEHKHDLIKYTDNVLVQLKKLNKMLMTELRFIQDAINKAQKTDDRIELHPTLYKGVETCVKLINQINETYKLLCATESVNQFMDEVLIAIRACSPALQQDIFSRLKDKGPLFAALVGDQGNAGQRTIAFG